MDNFRTHIQVDRFDVGVHHGEQVVFLGSCFAENIGARLQDFKVPTCINPFGILFNPFSVVNALERMANDRPYEKDDLMQHGEHWLSLDHHGQFNHRDKALCLEQINSSLQSGSAALKKANVVFVTLGSAWVHVLKEQNHIVANCHKIPSTAFQKRMLSFQEIHLMLRSIPDLLRSCGSQAEVVFTVSPVRHWKDGPVQNQRSKANLIAAVHELVEAYDQCHYFPAYELVMDDLRDYRFYGSDMLHLTPQAIDYVWQKFEDAFFDDETRIICKEVKAIIEAAAHRPVDPESNSFQRFVRKQLDLIEALKEKYPNLDLSKEEAHFSSYLL